MCHYCTQIIAFLKRAHDRSMATGSDLAILTLNVWAADDDRFILRYKEALGLAVHDAGGEG